MTDVVIVGGGTMGAGIAEALVAAGVAVTVVEPDARRASAARERILEGTSDGDPPAGESERDRPPFAIEADLPRRVRPELVIEAIPEDVRLKAEVLGSIERAFPSLPLLATNTSSISIDELASSLQRADAFLGMHFFNPVRRSRLVEIVVGTATGADAIERAVRWVERLGKESIQVRDSPGFATSRLGLAVGLEAIRMVEEGVASIEDIDRGMVLGYKYPIGPLALTDVVGLDVRLAIAEYLASTLGDRFSPPRLLREKVANGELGRKVGKGFYEW